jgi:hypothetical protein
MTVNELIKKLQELPDYQKEWRVATQGCDCDAYAVDVVVDGSDIMITR